MWNDFWKRIDEGEPPLSREARARLPFLRQLVLYLDPFALFKNAGSGPARVREVALSYNRAMRWMLIPYIRRWVLIAAALFLGIAPAEAAAAQASIFIVPAAAFAVGSCVAAAIVACTLAAYVLLGASRS